MYHFKIKSIRTAIESAEAQVKRAETKLAKLVFDAKVGNLNTSEHTILTCQSCGKGSQIKSYRYSDRYWYEKPYGCMAGDQWYFDGYNIECPNCNAVGKVQKCTRNSTNLEVAEYETLERLLRHATRCEDNMEK